jgi:hypothetical protein
MLFAKNYNVQTHAQHSSFSHFPSLFLCSHFDYYLYSTATSGNMLFRGIVRNHKKRYCSPETKKSDKNIIAQEVVEMVVQSGGRFLELAEEYDGASVLTGPWRHASYAKCVEKTCQALR